MKISKYLLITSILFVSCSNPKQNNKEDILLIIERFENKDSTITKDEVVNILSLLDNNDDSLTEVIYDNAFLYFYNKDANTCLFFLKKKLELLKLQDNLQEYAICTQNIAFVYDEKLHDYKLAEEYSLEAMAIWEKNNDILNTANMLKYIGYINGKLENFSAAKSYINKSINKYTALKYEKGLAVCYFDLALVFMYENVNDSVLFFLKKSKNIWSKYSEVNRIFKINNQILQLTSEQKSDLDFIECYNSNVEILESHNVLEQDILEFKEISLRK